LPFCRCKVGPAHATGEKIIAIVFHHMEKGVVGLQDLALEIPGEDSNDVSVD
jgi:hypothetical protein